MEHGLQVEWIQEKPESASGGGVTQPIGVVYVPVGLAGCNGIIRFTVVEQDVPPPLPMGIMRTLQASLDLTDDGDNVIFRQIGGKSSSRTLQSGHTVIRADQFDPDGWQLPGITEPCQNNDEGSATNYMSVIVHVYQRPTCVDDDTSAGDHDPASTQLQTTAEHNIERQPRFKSGKQTHGASQWTSSRGDQYLEIQRHGTLWTIKQWKRLAHHMLYVRCAAFFDTLSREFLMLIPMGRSRGHLACIATTGATKDEEQEEQCCESSGGSVGARQSPTERQPGNPVEVGAERLRSLHRLRSRREATL